jgi:CIC family chloride channel protein
LKHYNFSDKDQIPVSISIQDTLSNEKMLHVQPVATKRILFISFLALLNAVIVGFLAKALIYLVNFFTGLFFYGDLSVHEASPAQNNLGAWVIAIPVIGGVLVGCMARYGSKAIRGHGIPEAMEKILTEESRIPPLITFLKPFSAAISIGTGGPFGAEGPIIATGGAFGSFTGQVLKITAQERKVLLAAGATAGMTAIFGTPFAAILLAIELLLFEFSPKSFIPVVIACITGACMHFFLFSNTATFPMPQVAQPDRNAIIAYACIGILIGFASVIVTKMVYAIEDAFEKLPVHWMWWPAIGGLAVGIVGYIAPQTLGVGYQNITNALTGELAINVLVSLCLWKFASWAIALGSGTSGGTLAPLLTIGSSLGCLLGMAGQHLFPAAHISLPLAALVGMAALFAGSARALLTAIVFALETTMQENTLLPLIAGCVTSYIISFIFMRTTIMTEKITRRGIVTPDSYTPDVMTVTKVEDVLEDMNDHEDLPVINEENSISELKEWLTTEGISYNCKTLLVISNDNMHITGVLDKKNIFSTSSIPSSIKAKDIANPHVSYVHPDQTLQAALKQMLITDQDLLPVTDRSTNAIIGTITYRDIFKAYEHRYHEDTHRHRHISTRRKTLKVLVKGKQLFRS